MPRRLLCPAPREPSSPPLRDPFLPTPHAPSSPRSPRPRLRAFPPRPWRPRRGQLAGARPPLLRLQVSGVASRGARASAEQVTVVSTGVAASLALAADTDEGAVPGTQGDTSVVRGAEPLGVLRFATGAGAWGEAPAGAAPATLGRARAVAPVGGPPRVRRNARPAASWPGPAPFPVLGSFHIRTSNPVPADKS